MEDVGERVGRVPGFGKVAVEIHLVVALEEAAESKPPMCRDCASVAKRGSRLVGLDSMRKVSEDGLGVEGWEQAAEEK